MGQWYNNLTAFSQVMFIIAIVSTVLLLVQIILLVVGFEFEGGDFDASPSVDIVDELNDGGFLDLFGLKMFSIRGIISFLSIGGWVGFIISDSTDIIWLSCILAFVAGFVAMFLFALGLKKAMDLQSDGTLQIDNSVGKVGSVYLTIPAKKSGTGKINVMVQERLVELDAVTDDEENIQTGSEVIIVEVINNTVLVKRK